MTFKEIMEAVDLASPNDAFEIAERLLEKYDGEDLDLIKPAVYEVAARRIEPELT
tara:strand:- start:48 stop:212 length:165 start_codon:yes stop_codon:yes gene_type:complete